jgi:hypothetical protein
MNRFGCFRLLAVLSLILIPSGSAGGLTARTIMEESNRIDLYSHPDGKAEINFIVFDAQRDQGTKSFSIVSPNIASRFEKDFSHYLRGLIRFDRAGRQELIDTSEDCYLIKNIPREPDTAGFSYSYVWIKKNGWKAVKAEYYDREDILLRLIEAWEVNHIQNSPSITRILVKDLLHRGETMMEIKNFLDESNPAEYVTRMTGS